MVKASTAIDARIDARARWKLPKPANASTRTDFRLSARGARASAIGASNNNDEKTATQPSVVPRLVFVVDLGLVSEARFGQGSWAHSPKLRRWSDKV